MGYTYHGYTYHDYTYHGYTYYGYTYYGFPALYRLASADNLEAIVIYLQQEPSP